MDDDRNDSTDRLLDHEERTHDRTDRHDDVVIDRHDDVVVDDRRDLHDHRSDEARLSDAEVARVRTLLNDGTLDDGASRFKWFMLGFLAALLALVVAAGAFLVVSDADDDGQVDVNVPEVDVGG